MKSPGVEASAVETSAAVCSVREGRLGDDRNAQNGGGGQPQGLSAIGPNVKPQRGNRDAPNADWCHPHLLLCIGRPEDGSRGARWKQARGASFSCS